MQDTLQVNNSLPLEITTNVTTTPPASNINNASFQIITTTNRPSTLPQYHSADHNGTHIPSNATISIAQTFKDRVISTIDIDTLQSIGYTAQLLHVLSINLFILFLLIIAKGWPITRRDMPFKYAFFVFWIVCLFFDLLQFYWTSKPDLSEIRKSISLAKDIEFDISPIRLSLGLRIVIMIFFLLELRATMILEQEEKKLKFYLNFGALTMVWFIHSVVVYVISLRVEKERDWQAKLVNGFSAAANFIAFVMTTRLLWPKNSRSSLFRRSFLEHYTIPESGIECTAVSEPVGGGHGHNGHEDDGEDDGEGENDDDDGNKFNDQVIIRQNENANGSRYTVKENNLNLPDQFFVVVSSDQVEGNEEVVDEMSLLKPKGKKKAFDRESDGDKD